jgi:ABC-type nitrate/sulfonate/bicarbonate transport system substrate-binding protein
VLPEPFLTLAMQRGARRVASIFDAVCSKDCLITTWIARKDVEPVLAARFRNAVAAAAVWANQRQNRRKSGAILATYAPIDAHVLAKMTRTTYSTRLRVALAQPWIDVYAEFGAIPASFSRSTSSSEASPRHLDAFIRWRPGDGTAVQVRELRRRTGRRCRRRAPASQQWQCSAFVRVS